MQEGLVGLAVWLPSDHVDWLACAPHFQPITVDGDVLGARELSGPDWPPGSLVYTAPSEPNLRVVRERDTEHDDPEMHFTVLVVEPV